MNLAQVVDFDPATWTYRIDRDRACARRASWVVVGGTPPAPPAPPPTKRAESDESREIRAAFSSASQLLSIGELRRALPHIAPCNLRQRVSRMAARGILKCVPYTAVRPVAHGPDSSGTGYFRDFRYGLSTAGCT